LFRSIHSGLTSAVKCANLLSIQSHRGFNTANDAQFFQWLASGHTPAQRNVMSNGLVATGESCDRLQTRKVGPTVNYLMNIVELPYEGR